MRVTVTDRNYIRFMYGSPREHDMARYYGTIQGARGPTSRLGHRNSGLNVTAQSYNGDIEVQLDPGEGADDHCRIVACGHGGGESFVLYNGDIAEIRTMEGQKKWIKALVKHYRLRDELIREFAEEALKDRSTRDYP